MLSTSLAESDKHSPTHRAYNCLSHRRTTICRITVSDFPMAIFDFEHIEAAVNIVIRLQDVVRHQQENDHLDLMQQPASGARSHAIDFASRDTECGHFAPGQLNPNAPAFHPNLPNFWTHNHQKTCKMCFLYGKQELLLGKERLQRHTSLLGSFAQEMAFDVVSLPEESRFLMTSPSGGIDSTHPCLERLRDPRATSRDTCRSASKCGS